jgi:hypothetical protein
MANPNVIDYTNFSNSYALSRANHHHLSVRENEGEYGNSQTFLDSIQALLNQPLWPQFPNGAYLNPAQAARLYRAAQSIQGLTHILDRSAQSRGLTQDYENEPNCSLSESQESQLRAALIEIGTELVNLADDLHCRAQ